jgi:cobalt-zinc-cadmium efflux system outer membrane protein
MRILMPTLRIPIRSLTASALLALLAGCQTPSSTEDRLAELAWRPRASAVRPPIEPIRDEPEPIIAEAGDHATETEPAPVVGNPQPEAIAELPIQHVNFWDDPEPAPAPQSPEGTVVPPVIPGADASPIILPPLDPNQSPEEWRRQVAERYSPIPQLTSIAAPTENVHAWTLAELEAIAMSDHPALRQAWADVEIARGEAIQAGLAPNPTVGYQGDTIGTAGTAGYNGVHVSQTFVTADKLGLAESVEGFDVRSAEQRYRRERIEVLTNVRRHYVQALLAELRSELLGTMAGLAAEAYDTQIELVQIREAAPHEPLSLRSIALQLETERLQADRDAESAWRQLAAAAGQPHLPRGPLSGDVAGTPMTIEEASLVGMMLAGHTDLSIADIEISRAATDIALQDNMIVPNVDVAAVLQHDDTTPINDLSFNLFLAMPIPIIDQNQGNLFAAEARLSQSRAERDNVYRQLLGELAAAHQQYLASEDIASTYRDQILPDQVRYFRGVADRYRVAGEPSDFAEIVVAQQTLSGGIERYLDALEAQWDALIDIGSLLQVESLSELGISLDP